MSSWIPFYCLIWNISNIFEQSYFKRYVKETWHKHLNTHICEHKIVPSTVEYGNNWGQYKYLATDNYPNNM